MRRYGLSFVRVSIYGYRVTLSLTSVYLYTNT